MHPSEQPAGLSDTHDGDRGPRSSRVTDVVGAYVGLTKPRIIELLLVTTLPTMVIAQRGMPDLWLVVATMVGGTLAAGSANTFNSYFERDIDALMKRTRRRPMPNHRVPEGNALLFGIVLGVVSFATLHVFVNPLAAWLGVAAIAFYAGVYTLLLKRRTPQNVVIGGAAGCMPTLIAWAAVTGEVGAGAFVLFAIVFYWTPPHTWALAMKYEDDYARAGVPMLPVVAGHAETTKQITLYSILMVAVSLIFGPIGGMGTLYFVTAVVLGAIFLGYALRLARSRSQRDAMSLFRYSISYLGLLFIAAAVDAALLG